MLAIATMPSIIFFVCLIKKKRKGLSPIVSVAKAMPPSLTHELVRVISLFSNNGGENAPNRLE